MRSLFDTSHEDGYQEGVADGKVVGRAEGIQSKALDIARNLKRMGMNVEQIIQATGLSSQEIEQL